MKNKNNICIFGLLDSEVGQIYSFLETKEKKRVKFFVHLGKIKKVNIRLEHKRRPNKKTAFYKNGKMLGLNVYDQKNYTNAIKKFAVKECYIIESNIKKRFKIYKIAKKLKLNIKTFIHSTVVFGNKKSTDIGEGTIIFPQNYIGYKTDIGKCCIIQSNCNLEHHNKIGDFCNINPGVFTGGFTKIGSCSEIHLGAKVINKINIGKNCKIGAGSLVLKNIKNDTLAYGSPAKKVKKTILF